MLYESILIMRKEGEGKSKIELKFLNLFLAIELLS